MSALRQRYRHLDDNRWQRTVQDYWTTRIRCEAAAWETELRRRIALDVVEWWKD